MSKCSCETLEKTRRELKAAQKRIAEREADLLALGRRCAASLMKSGTELLSSAATCRELSFLPDSTRTAGIAGEMK